MKVNSVLLLIGGVAVGGWYLKNKAGAAVEAVSDALNPTKDTNLAYRGASAASIATGVSGTHNGYSYDDHLFAAFDLLNPFNESDVYAGKVWGVGGE